jgi:hypothetical protein
VAPRRLALASFLNTVSVYAHHRAERSGLWPVNRMATRVLPRGWETGIDAHPQSAITATSSIGHSGN